MRLKRYPLLACLCITGVRSIVVNLGVALHFTRALTDAAWTIPGPVWALTLFALPFSLAIAILKDVPDAEGDRRFSIATFTLRLGAERVMRLALCALTAAYAGMAIAGPLLLDDCQPAVLAATHVAVLATLWRMSARTDAHDRASFTAFYMGVWKLFFLEYTLVPLAVVLG